MESKTEQQQSGNERLSWHELNSYTTAKLALRQINEALSHADNSLKAGGDGKNAILRTAGEFVTEAVDAIAGKTDGDYSKLLDKATNIGVDLINEGLIQKFELTVDKQAPITGDYSELLETAKDALDMGIAAASIKFVPIGDTHPDREILETANYVGLLGMRLTEDMLDLEQEGLPVGFVKFKALDYTIGQFEKAAKRDKGWNRKVKDSEFTEGYGIAVDRVTTSVNQIKENFARARYVGKIDFKNGLAHVTSSALTHFNAGLADEKDAVKIGLYERSARLVMSMYDALVSDDTLYASKKFFENETEAFKSGRGPNAKNMHWEMDSLIGKLETYGKLVDEATSVVDGISRNELTANGENDMRPTDTYFLANTDKITNLGKEIFGSVTALFENTFSPAAQSYSRLDGEKAKKCIDTEKRVAEKLAGLSALYNAWGAVLQHNDGKRINAAEFETYHSMVKQQIENAGRKA